MTDTLFHQRFCRFAGGVEDVTDYSDAVAFELSVQVWDKTVSQISEHAGVLGYWDVEDLREELRWKMDERLAHRALMDFCAWARAQVDDPPRDQCVLMQRHFRQLRGAP